jgi:GntR family transcriptional regulator
MFAAAGPLAVRMTRTERPAHPMLGASPMPRYVRLADIFRQRIARGVWPKDTMMPTIEQLMQEFSVSRVTVRQAVRLLSDQGLVSPRRGLGTLINNAPPKHRSLKVHTTLEGLVGMFAGQLKHDEVTNVAESHTSPALQEDDGIAAPRYFHMRRVQARDGIKYALISLYLDDRVFAMAPDRFRNEIVLPVLLSLPCVTIARARQTMRIGRADVEVTGLLGISVGEPMAEVRRVLVGPDDTVVYVAEIAYHGDQIYLDMDLRPDVQPETVTAERS